MKYELYDEKVFEDDDCVGERGSLFHSCSKKKSLKITSIFLFIEERGVA